ncbi:putative late blight resistance protein homolog R1C-3 isoform X1 [Nicotiana tabacum]|uniref:Late blight resistance protein homolog R1C-3 n=2 Tax=Nicotiana TaxID=4085 RepID=A0A1S4CF31_TOBAC|nr:PREDICTED: putative late blight resistance protein homolog R1C-3 [Nicotiana tabacum]
MSPDPIDVRDPVSILQRIENEHDWTGCEKNRTRAVKTELWFLGIFLRMKPDPLQMDIRSFMDDAGAQFLSDYYIILDGKEPHNFDANCSNVLAKIQHYKQSSRADISNLEISSSSPLSHELLVEFTENIVHNLKDLLIVCFGEPPALRAELFSMYSEVNDQMEVVEKELRALKNFVVFVGKICSAELQSCRQTFLRHAEHVVTLVAIIFFLYMPNLNDGKSVSLEFTDLLSGMLQKRIKPIEPQVRNIYTDVLRDLRSSNTPPMSSIEPAAGFINTLLHISDELRALCTLNKVQTETLLELLSTLRNILDELALTINIQDKMRVRFFRRVETLVIDTGVIVYSLYDSTKSKEDRDQDLLLLADKIQLVKKQIYLDIREGVQSHLPKNDVLGIFVFLLDSLKELLCSHSDSLASVKNQLDVVLEELQLFQPFLNGIAEKGNNKHDELQNLAKRITDKAYEVEYIVDSFVVGDIPLTYLTVWLSEILWEIKLINKELLKSSEMRMSEIASPAANEELVGFNDVRETIVGLLLGGSPQLDVVSIVGMPGTGKTTLARSFINDRSTKFHFSFRAECRVSQVYTRRDLLLSLLSDSNDEITDLSKLDDNDLASRLRKVLLKKGRYLLIVDDVWENNAWDDLKLCFPDDKNGSRIILTTRHQKVANYAKCVTDPLNLRLFNNDESWLLLQKKVFGTESPEGLRQVGQEIAKKCEGLPISVVLVAGLLARMDKTEQCWKQMELNLGERIQGNSKILIKLSYFDLPYKLKPCFLYFGAFLEDREIVVSKLINLWIAEGFIENEKEKYLEDIAEDYLEDLLGRNLIMETKKRSNGKIKACRVHDLLLEFCKEKAKEDNFLLWLKRDYDSVPPHFYSGKPMHRRLSFCSNQDDLAGWRPSCSHARSVLFREVSDNTFSVMKNASYIFGSFKFLRVLDLEFVVVESFPTELNHLRYLAVQTTEDSIPSSIGNLSNLQTVIVKRTGDTAVHIPDTFWKLTKLRHVSIGDRASFDLHSTQESLDRCPSKLGNLTTLSSPYVSRAEDMERIVSRTPNLRKLKCIFAD